MSPMATFDASVFGLALGAGILVTQDLRRRRKQDRLFVKRLEDAKIHLQELRHRHEAKA